MNRYMSKIGLLKSIGYSDADIKELYEAAGIFNEEDSKATANASSALKMEEDTDEEGDGSVSYNLGNSGIVTSNNSGSVTNSSIYGYSIKMAAPVVKTKLRYIVVKKDKTTLVLSEQPQITPREMIGICKFLNQVSSSGAVGYNISIHWSQLITQLSIEKHFTVGQDEAWYRGLAIGSVVDEEVLNIFLYDPT